MDDDSLEKRGLSMPQWLRLGEYGVVLTVIPGAFLAILTGQFALAASPIFLSLGLNLLRRSYGDRLNRGRVAERHQDVTLRGDSILESLKREREDFLLESKGRLHPRDLPQLLTLLRSKLVQIEETWSDVEQSRSQLSQILEQDLPSLQETQRQQERSLNWIRTSGIVRTEGQLLQEKLQMLRSHVDALEARGISQQSPFAFMSDRIATLEHELERQLPKQERRRSLLEYWNLWAETLQHRIETLQVLYLGLRVESLHDSLSGCIREWETSFQSQKETLLSLQERWQSLKDAQDLLDVQIEAVIETVAEQKRSDRLMDFDRVDWQLKYDLDQIRQEISEIQSQCEQQLQFEQALIAEEVQVVADSTIEPMLNRCAELLENEALADNVNVHLTPILQHLSECDERFMHLSQTLSYETLKAQVDSTESKLSTLANRLETISVLRCDRDREYQRMRVHLAMIRVNLEELNAHVNLDLEQIPYQVETYIRKKFAVLSTASPAPSLPNSSTV